MTRSVQSVLTRSRLCAAMLAMVISGGFDFPAMAQLQRGMGSRGVLPPTSRSASEGSGLTGSVPSGAPTNELLHLALRDAITRALRSHLATIETGENARIRTRTATTGAQQALPQVRRRSFRACRADQPGLRFGFETAGRSYGDRAVLV